MTLNRRSLLRGSILLGSGALVGAGVADGVERVRADLITPEALASTIAPSPARGALQVWWSAPSGSQAVGGATSGGETTPRLALSFDDGPTEQFTARVLDVLAAEQAVATFFVIGELARRHPDLLRRARDAGHEIDNHSDDHLSAVRTDASSVRASMARCAETLEQLTGRRPRFFRPPRGEVTTATLLAAQAESHELVLWSVARGGSDGGAADADVAGIARHLEAAAHAGGVVDLHDGIGRSAWVGLPDATLISRREAELRALPQVLQTWREQGWQLVTLDALLPR